MAMLVVTGLLGLSNDVNAHPGVQDSADDAFYWISTGDELKVIEPWEMNVVAHFVVSDVRSLPTPLLNGHDIAQWIKNGCHAVLTTPHES